MENNAKILLGALIFIIVIYFIVSMCTCEKKRENFGSQYDGGLTMNLPGGIPYNPARDVNPSLNTFADVVAPVNVPQAAKQYLPLKAGENMDYRDMLPDMNTHAVSYDVDISSPNSFLWAPSVRATIHNRNHINSGDYLRGDLPIVKQDQGWFNSRYNEADARLDGYFSEYTNAKFAALTGQRSYPQHISNEGLIMDGSNERVIEY